MFFAERNVVYLHLIDPFSPFSQTMTPHSWMTLPHLPYYTDLELPDIYHPIASFAEDHPLLKRVSAKGYDTRSIFLLAEFNRFEYIVFFLLGWLP